MPTMHHILRETLRKHDIDSLPWENNDDLTGRTNSNKKAKMATTDGAIRPEEHNDIARAVSSISSNSRIQPPYNTTGMDSISNDEGGFYSLVTSSSSLHTSNDIDKRRKPSEPKVNKRRTYMQNFFTWVDELKAYKEKHGHLHVRQKEDISLYNFCSNLRQARKGKGCYRLDDFRIAALDAIGFKWEIGADASITDRFSARVDKLKEFKVLNGHLNVTKRVDSSLHNFCSSVRRARRNSRKGTHYKLTEDQIAVLDAIGFNWNSSELTTSPCAMSKTSHDANGSMINVGDVGYQFRKEFDSGWYKGTVAEILQDNDDGWDRRCVYEDGDCEDLTLYELNRLATLSPHKHVGTIKVVGDVKMVEDGVMKMAASVGVSILAAKENPVIQKAASLKHRPVSKTMTSSTDDLFLTKNSKSPSNNNKAMAADLASLSSFNYDDLTLGELKRLPALTPHVVAIEKVLRSMRTVEEDGVKRFLPRGCQS